MDPDARDELAMVIAALLGIFVGHVVRRRRLSPAGRADDVAQR